MPTPAATTIVGEFSAFGYAITAFCACGHRRTISAAFLVWRLGPDYQMGLAGREALARLLRCHKCDARNPRLEMGRGWGDGTDPAGLNPPR